jgi:uncharacterized RDD family membrane protein YckC
LLATPAGLLRRLCALLYDGIVLIALCLVATVPFLPLTGGDAVTGIDTPQLEPFYQAAMLAVMAAYSAYSWTHGGQTIGMRAWRLRVERDDGSALDGRRALLRFAAATVSLLAVGLGFVWACFDPQRRTWHDRWTHTRVVLVPRRATHAQTTNSG